MLQLGYVDFIEGKNHSVQNNLIDCTNFQPISIQYSEPTISLTTLGKHDLEFPPSARRRIANR